MGEQLLGITEQSKAAHFICRYCNGVDLGAPATQKPACFCPRLAAAGLNGLFKHSDLGPGGISCTEFCK